MCAFSYCNRCCISQFKWWAIAFQRLAVLFSCVTQSIDDWSGIEQRCCLKCLIVYFSICSWTWKLLRIRQFQGIRAVNRMQQVRQFHRTESASYRKDEVYMVVEVVNFWWIILCIDPSVWSDFGYLTATTPPLRLLFTILVYLIDEFSHSLSLQICHHAMFFFLFWFYIHSPRFVSFVRCWIVEELSTSPKTSKYNLCSLACSVYVWALCFLSFLLLVLFLYTLLVNLLLFFVVGDYWKTTQQRTKREIIIAKKIAKKLILIKDRKIHWNGGFQKAFACSGSNWFFGVFLWLRDFYATTTRSHLWIRIDDANRNNVYLSCPWNKIKSM